MWTRAAVVLAAVHGASAKCTTCGARGEAEDGALLQQIGHPGQNSLHGYHPALGGHGRQCREAVYDVQAEWKAAILKISEEYLAEPRGDFVGTAEKAIAKLYGYEMGPVMFKPTKAVEKPFRPTSEGALSYFVGYDAIKPRGMKEDGGFAICNGEGWSKVVMVNDQISCMDDAVLVHGYYYFTNAKTGAEVAVEYSFVYKWSLHDELKIILHHSSVPFQAGEAEQGALKHFGHAWHHPGHRHHPGYGPRPDFKGCVCKHEVDAVQAEWKAAILKISEDYLAEPQGDFVLTASNAIDELYGYDMGPVMFKPTKAVEEPFRPTFMGAESYFVGYDAIKPEGVKEDGGFAICNGDGWSKVVFKNDQISCMGDVILAHGYYYFTNAKTGEEVAVEYSFAYKWNKEDKLKIILHHSSVPFQNKEEAGYGAVLKRAGSAFKEPAFQGCYCKEAVHAVQAEWRAAILKISAEYTAQPDHGYFVETASKAIHDLYGYDMGPVLFKPTKAVNVPFRPTFMGALSYMVGHEALKPEGIEEDQGFAICGGDGWSEVVFENDYMSCMGDVALVHGHYHFTNAKTGAVVTVEYSFVYKWSAEKKLKIILHHSSVPFPGSQNNFE